MPDAEGVDGGGGFELAEFGEEGFAMGGVEAAEDGVEFGDGGRGFGDAGAEEDFAALVEGGGEEGVGFAGFGYVGEGFHLVRAQA